MLLSSGERTLSATMTEGGKRAKAGQEARLMDVPCARRFGLFDERHGFANGRALSDALRTAAAHHGHAGPALVERLVSDPSDLGEALAA
jgi:putative DNA primase/helicase